MDLPIPTHLQAYLKPVGDENTEFEVRGELYCLCGCEEFEVWESNDRQIVKAKCKQCGQEIEIFDSGRHGWNGFVCHDDFLDCSLPFNKYTCSECGQDIFKVSVYISSQGKQDYMEEADDEAFSEDNWVNAFEWISLSLNCKKCSYVENGWLDMETM